MQVKIFIAPHERYEALEAYKDRLTKTQIDAIKEADEEASIEIEYEDSITQVIITERNAQWII
jgi:hypothetical protein